MHSDKHGNRHEAYRTAKNDAPRIEANGLFAEPGRILIAASTVGIFDFARPNQPRNRVSLP